MTKESKDKFGPAWSAILPAVNMFSSKDKKKPTWKELLKREAPVQLPAAHDALTAKLIQRAGFAAYQIGGFALVGARHGLPDIDLTRFAEQSAGVRDILPASSLPVLVDADDGYGDVKNVTHTVQSYEAMGVSAIFLEDQVSPKRCGHMSGKKVIQPEVMEERISAAAAARTSEDFFLVARTDAREPEGLDSALRRAERYVRAGADGIYVEAPKSVKEIEEIGKALPGTPQMTNMFEGDNETPWLTPKELGKLGFSMILYPTSLLFRVVRSIQRGLEDLKAGKQVPHKEAVDMSEYEDITGLARWAEIENRFQHGHGH
ncbi:MAG: isocitrate lyase/PEP mutase family protein [Acidobacteriaceae bacterium]|nr:isocitrate lyase/PEP mutase family protein [Acidobacteriaceae bacterium]